MKMQKILVIEDEEHVLEVVKAYLKKDGYETYTAVNGKEGLALFQKKTPNLVVLDLMLPDVSGEDICQQIRKQSNVPILMLTAKSAVEDRIAGLGMGADDYLIKPFSPKELVMRIKAVLRRVASTEPLADMISFRNEDLKVDAVQQAVYKKGVAQKLTPIEYKLLMLFIRNPNRVFNRDELIDKIFGMDFEGYDRTIDAHIKNLRRKIEDDSRNPWYITTIFGVGYKFVGEKQ